MSDDTKKLILARRARFVAAAIAGVAVSACDKPRACLEPPMATSTSPTFPRPSVCLSPPHRPPIDGGDPPDDLADKSLRDAATDAPSDAAKGARPVGPPAPSQPPRAK